MEKFVQKDEDRTEVPQTSIPPWGPPPAIRQPDKNIVEQAPWTIQQTFFGTFITLVPWIMFALVISTFSGSTVSPNTTPLSPQRDLIASIIALVFSTIIEGAFLIAPLYYARSAFRTIPTQWRLTWKALGFRRFSVGRTFFWIVVLMIAILAVDNIYQYIISVLHLNLQTNDQMLLQHSKEAPLTTYATLVAAVVIAPFCEEIFFRGFIFPGLCRGMPVGWAIVFSALLFAVAHADPGSFAVLFVIGIAFAFLRWRTKSIWPGMLLHIFNNGIGALVIILYMQGVIKV